MFSTDKEELNKSVSELQGKLEKLTGVVKVNTDLSATVEEIQMSVKKEAAIDFGLTPAQIAQTETMQKEGYLQHKLFPKKIMCMEST